MPIGRWLREGRFTFPPTKIDGLRPKFATRKLRAHLADQSDERLFLWCHWLLTQWLSRGAG